MPDGKGPRLELPQPPEPSPVPNRGLAKPELPQLHPSHHPVLAVGQIPDRSSKSRVRET